MSEIGGQVGKIIGRGVKLKLGTFFLVISLENKGNISLPPPHGLTLGTPQYIL